MKNKILTLGIVLFLLALNIYLTRPLFSGEYDANTGSIGIAHILNARYLSRFWNVGWNPFWYGGFPNHLIYPLLAPIFLALVQKASLVLTMPQVYRIVTAFAVALIPVTTFFLVRYFSKRTLTGFLAALIFSLAPSANYFLIFGHRMIGQAREFVPWRYSVLVDFGEGPHLIALAIVPLAVIAYWRLLREPSFYKFVSAAFLISVVISINLFSAYALAYFLLGVFLSEFLLGQRKEKVLLSFYLILLVYGLIAYCYDLSMINSLSRSGYIHPENVFRLPPVTNLLLIFVLGVMPLAYLAYELLKNKPRIQNGLALTIWFLIFWLIPYAFYKGHWFGSQPNRYMPELNLTAAMIIAVVLGLIHDLLKKYLGLAGKVLALLWLGICLGGLTWFSRGFILEKGESLKAHPDITASSEYQIAVWLEENIDYQNGERAHLSGSPAFFLNEFADVPQMRGDEDNAQADPWWADVVYQVNRGEDAELAIGWLQAYNVQYAVIDYGANTPYADFRNVNRFDKLKTVEEISGFKIKKIPGKKNILQAVEADKVEGLRPFSHPEKAVLDKGGLKIYLKAIEEPEGVEVSYQYLYRTKPDLATVWVKNALEETGILFKTTYDRGWRAKVISENGKVRRAQIVRTGPSLMLVKPETAGSYTLELSYHRPLVEYLGYVTTIGTLFALGILGYKKRNFKIVFEKEKEKNEAEDDY